MLDVSTLSHEFKPHVARPVLPGRVLQVDGDFVAYFVSSATENSFDDMKHNASVILSTLKESAGAESLCIHLTPWNSSKGNRREIAKLKPYQQNRENKTKPEYLESVRYWLRDEYNAILWTDLEADDGISIYQHAALDAKHPELSVIVSKDKDLKIIPGLHLDWVTGELTEVTPLGELKQAFTKSGNPKIVGSGFKFFCLQMLMGDPADNISGIPMVYHNGRFRKCGQMTAYEMLAGARTRKQALDIITNAYKHYGTSIGFKDYLGNPLDTWEAFVSEAKLLWMRRYNDENDVLVALKEILE